MKYSFHESEIEITHFKGSGPGGQNRNKRMTGVRIVHIPTGLVAVATERRSQEQNLHAAMERLEERLKAYYYRPPPRYKTKPTKGSKERRVNTKVKRSVSKRLRKKISAGYDD